MPTHNPILLTIENNVLLLAFPLVLIILIYLANPITHLTASSLHKITKKEKKPHHQIQQFYWL
jgi:hypothetical protein